MVRWGFSALLACLAWPAVAAELAPETPKVLVPGPSNGHRLYIGDTPMAHAVDSKIIVLDGDNLKLVGQFTNGFFGLLALSPDGATIYSATTFFARGDHGTRTDVIELYDAATLDLAGEIGISTHRAETTAYVPYLQPSAGGQFLFVQNATPASSVTVVDAVRRRQLAEIPTAGCAGVYPSPVVAGRFSSLCGDGAAITIDVDADGHERARRRSAKLFDPVDDALFIDGVTTWDRTIFVSFLGNIHSIDFTGPVAAQAAPWKLVTGADATDGWRPGGYQIAAYNKATGQLYVTMHAHGYEGSHKSAADEIWRVDVAHHTVMARGAAKGTAVVSVTQDAAALLFGLSFDTGVVTRYNGDTLAPLASTQPGGVVEGGTLMLVH
jgi:methylamine dehydrogenase heavy chain